MNILTDWRKAVQQHLAENLQDGAFEVRAGRRDGKVRDKKLVVVFVPTLRPDANVNFARPQLIVRAWVPEPKQPKSESPQDPEPVEQLLVDLAETLKEVRVLPDIGDGRGLYFEIGQITPDYDDWGVEATLNGWMTNPGALPWPQ